jgi:hypothetical protein
MLRGEPADPDYTSPWPRTGTVGSVRLDNGTAVVDLSGVDRAGVGSAMATAAVQQLVWTVTAVAADAGGHVDAVRLLVDGARPASFWGHVNLSRDLVRAAAQDTLAQVWLISPQNGDTVNRDFTVHVAGSVPEAAVVVRVLNPTGDVVRMVPMTLDKGAPERGEAMMRITSLDPGTYTIEAYFESPADGSVQAVDNHEITVR